MIPFRKVAGLTRQKREMEPFRVDVPDEVLNDLHARLKLTRWADDFANERWQYGDCVAEATAVVFVRAARGNMFA